MNQTYFVIKRVSDNTYYRFVDYYPRSKCDEGKEFRDIAWVEDPIGNYPGGVDKFDSWDTAVKEIRSNKSLYQGTKSIPNSLEDMYLTGQVKIVEIFRWIEKDT